PATLFPYTTLFRSGGAGLQYRRGHGRSRAAGPAAAAGGWRGRGRPVLRGTPVRWPGAGVARPVAAGRLPLSGSAVRELVDALRGDAGGAPRGYRCAAGDHGAWP